MTPASPIAVGLDSPQQTASATRTPTNKTTMPVRNTKPETSPGAIDQLRALAAAADLLCGDAVTFMSTNRLGSPVAVSNARRGRELLGQARQFFNAAADQLEDQ